MRIKNEEIELNMKSAVKKVLSLTSPSQSPSPLCGERDIGGEVGENECEKNTLIS